MQSAERDATVFRSAPVWRINKETNGWPGDAVWLVVRTRWDSIVNAIIRVLCLCIYGCVTISELTIIVRVRNGFSKRQQPREGE